MADYSKFLYHQYVIEHFKLGVSEVHLVFDNPTMNTFNPKQFEQARRHYSENTMQHRHQHHAFDVNSQIPQGWPEFLECTTCKRAIVESIGLYFLQIGHCLLQQQQQLIIGGCFADEFAWLITSGMLPEKVQNVMPPMLWKQTIGFGDMQHRQQQLRFSYVHQILMYTT